MFGNNRQSLPAEAASQRRGRQRGNLCLAPTLALCRDRHGANAPHHDRREMGDLKRSGLHWWVKNSLPVIASPSLEGRGNLIVLPPPEILRR